MSQLPSTATLKKETNASEDNLLSFVRGLVKMSRTARSQYYPIWDKALMNFRGEKEADAKDRKAADRGEPTKFVVPLTRSQVMSFVSFNWLLMSQNQKFYELEPTGDEDYLIRPDCELILKRDTKKNKWASTCVQFLLDQCLCAHGVLDCSWEECWYRYLVEEQTEGGEFYGTQIAGETTQVQKKILKSEGNKVTNISPYRWFPDTRLPLAKYQEGEFVATEDEISKSALRRLESEGLVKGVKDIPTMTQEVWSERGTSHLPYFANLFNGGKNAGNKTGAPLTGDTKDPGSMYIVTRVQVDITPADYEFEGKPLGKETWPERYLIWYANDQKIIRCEKMNVLHGMFTQVCGEFSPDHHHLINQGLCEVIDKLQSTISWYISSHVRAVNNVINNKLVVDPMGVNMKSLEDPEQPFILLQKNAARQGVDKWIQQIKVQDTTSGHMADAQVLTTMVQLVTGINDNAQGQYNSGRRSATEARAVTAGAAGRLKTHAELNWTNVFQPLGHMMLTNARQMMSIETFIRIIGQPKPGQEEQYAARFAAFKGTLEDLVGGDDFFVFDSTLSSEKGFVAQSLQELFVAIIANPLIAQSLNIDPRAMLKEIMFLRGVHNFSRFDLAANVATGQTPQPTIQNGPTEPNGGEPTGTPTA